MRSLFLSFLLITPFINQAQVSIEEHLKGNKIKAKKTESGLYYKIESAGKGRKPVKNDIVTVHYRGTLLTGQKFDASYDRGEPIQFGVGTGEVIPGWDEGLMLLKEGSKATFYIPAELAYGSRRVGELIPANSPLKFEVDLLKVQTQAEVEKEKAQQALLSMQKDETSIQEYLKEKGLKAQKTGSGLYYVVEEQGSGLAVAPGQTVSVHYVGTLLNGKKFDSSRDRDQPFSFPIGQGRVIKGWDEGIPLFNVGGKGLLIIPSALGYGSRNMGAIPPNSVLLFDIEVMGVN